MSIYVCACKIVIFLVPLVFFRRVLFSVSGGRTRQRLYDVCILNFQHWLNSECVMMCRDRTGQDATRPEASRNFWFHGRHSNLLPGRNSKRQTLICVSLPLSLNPFSRSLLILSVSFLIEWQTGRLAWLSGKSDERIRSLYCGGANMNSRPVL